MLTVYLADDEPVILRGLRKLLDWESHGLKIIGESRNGADLIRGIHEKRPDLVITDISMPSMDGIEVLKRIRDAGIHTQVIFISAYREFSYAQDALSYGAAGYLIKPISRIKLEEAVRKTVADIHSETRVQLNGVKLRELETKQKKQAELDEIKGLLEQKEGKPKTAVIHAMKGDDPNVSFSTLVLESGSSLPFKVRWGEGQRRLLQFAIQNIVEEMLVGEWDGWVVHVEERLCVILRHSREQVLERLAENIHANINTYLKQGVTIGVGLPGSLSELPEHYRNCLEALKYAFFVGHNRIFRVNALPPVPESGRMDRETMEKELLRDAFSPTSDPGPSLNRLLGEIRRQSWGKPAYAISMCNTLMTKLLHGLQPREDVWRDEAEQELFIRLQACSTVDDMFEWMSSRLWSARAVWAEGSKESKLIVEMKRYIDENYRSEINLETMAGRFYMNPYYFSTFFKKHVGQNFKPYLTEVRLREATHLLLHSDGMLYEIAEKTGFSNARQFSEIFKKYYGELPNDYRLAKRK